jgi:hypothetical protein
MKTLPLKHIYEKKIDIFHAVDFISENYGLMDWVSLGSGFGATEKIISENNNIQFVSLIDPSPKDNCWSIKPSDENHCLTPTHKYMHDLLKDNSDLINKENTVLMIDWPYAIGLDETSGFDRVPRYARDESYPTINYEGCEDYPYDIEGISLLLPKIVIVRYSESGESGTRTLRSWLNKSGARGGNDYVNSFWSGYYIPEILEKVKYKVIYSVFQNCSVNQYMKSVQNVVILERC